MFEAKGSGDYNHSIGVSIIVNDQIKKTVKTFTAIFDTVILLQLNEQPFNNNIIQVYAPTCKISDEKIELFYHQILLNHSNGKL